MMFIGFNLALSYHFWKYDCNTHLTMLEIKSSAGNCPFNDQCRYSAFVELYSATDCNQ